MERLTIDEVIGHCERHTEKMESMSSREQLEETPIGNSDRMKQYWEHRQVAEWLEELKQYRAIGTVEEMQSMKDNGAFTGVELASIACMQIKLKDYQSIGTIEEFKVLKNKNTPMELAEHNFQDEVHHYLCPSCRSIVSYNQNYCEECGQALET